MRSYPLRKLFAFLLAVSATWIASQKTFAASGTWTQATSGGLWSATGNWSGSTVADGSGFSADFSTIDITADNTVHMDASHTLTSLIFGDTATGTAAGWTVDNNGTAANTLTLAGTTPSITVNALGTGKSATISAVIAGTTAWSKAGAGTLNLSGANTYSGGTTVSGGTLGITGKNALQSFRATTTINSSQTMKWDATGVGGTANSDTMGAVVAVSGANATINGQGTLVVTGNSTDFLGLGGTSGRTVTFSLGSGALIDIQGGNLRNGGFSGGVWTANLAGMNIASGAEFDVWDGNQVNVDALTGSGNVQNQSNSNSKRTLQVGVNNGSGTFSGVIGGGTRLGINHIAITKAGSGTQTLSGANTYVDGTTLSAGQLNINYGGSSSANSAIGTGTLTISGGTIDNTSAGDVTLLPNNAQSWNGNFTYAGSVHNLNLGAGAVTMNATRTVTVSANTLTVGGAIGGATFGLTKAGSGTLTLSGANTYTGNTTVSAGTLLVNGSTASGSAVSVSGSGSVLGGSGTINGATTISSSGALTPRPSGGSATTTTFGGNLTLSSASANFTVSASGASGNDQVVYGSSGTLTLDNTDTINITGATLDTQNDYTLFTSSGGTVSMATTPTLKINGTTSDQTSAGSYQLVKSGSLLKLHYIPTSLPPTVNSQSASPASLGHYQTTTVTVNVTPQPGQSISSVTVTLDQLGGAGDPTTLTPPGSGDGSGNWTGTFTVPATLAAGSKTISGTVFQSDAVTAGWSVSGITVTNASPIWSGGGGDNKWSTGGNWDDGHGPGLGDTVSFAGSTQLTNNLDASVRIISLTFNSGAGSFDITNAASTLTLTGGLTNNSTSAQTLDVPVALSGAQTVSPTGNVTINGTVLDSGAGFTLAGGGMLTLSGVNTYSGATTISSGLLAITGNGSLGSGTYSGNITDNGALNYGSSASQTLSGTISGTGSVTNSGIGTLTLSSANTFNGGVTINSGAVTLGNATAAGSGTITLSSGILQNNSSADLPIANNISVGSGGGTIQLNPTGGRNFTLTGVLSGSGNLTLAPAGGVLNSLQLQFSANTASGTITIPNSSGVNQTVTRFKTATSGSATATWSIGGAQDRYNTLDFASGTISFGALNGSGTIYGNSSGAAQIISVGALGTASAFSGSIQNGGSASVALTKVGSGTMTLSGANTYTGSTVVSNGVLALSGSGTITNSANIILFGATFDVSALSSTFTLGSGKQLIATNNATGTVAGNLNLGSGSLVLNYTNGTPSLLVTNGTFTFNNNAVTVIVSGTQLASGSYKLISKTTAGNAGLVAGTLPSSVTVNGAGAAFAATLQITGGELYLVVNHPPVASTMNVTRTAGLSVKIAWLDLATNWTDADADAMSLNSFNLTTTNGVTLQTNGTWILYTNNVNVNDQFSYTIIDARGATATGLVNIVINPFVTGQNTTVTVSGGTANVSFYGIPGYSYITQRATNIVTPNWVDIATNTAPGNGAINVTDSFSDLGNVPASAYYRLKWQP